MRAKLRPTRSKPSLPSDCGLVVPNGWFDAGSDQARDGREDTFDVTRPRDIPHLLLNESRHYLRRPVVTHYKPMPGEHSPERQYPTKEWCVGKIAGLIDRLSRKMPKIRADCFEYTANQENHGQCGLRTDLRHDQAGRQLSGLTDNFRLAFFPKNSLASRPIRGEEEIIRLLLQKKWVGGSRPKYTVRERSC